ncbi:P-loop containing nucleoside triphosphate hydrolase protein [Mycena olivaceomarginata]|nr:P-loop containing nucleoside triphosphate hydrolase protein [Mycena olivaceomarginata]
MTVCVFVEVIDTAGQEEYATLRDQWVREGQGFILIYSITSRSTFDRLEVFQQCDRPLDCEVSREEGAALARQFGCDFFETSAKTGLNVERVFTALVRALRPTKAISAGAESAKDVKKKCIIL